jgi:hypothetical protein
MTATPAGLPTTKLNAMGQSREDWQSYRLGERIIHTPAVHGAGWLALGWQRLNDLDAPMLPADAREEALTTPAEDANPVVIDVADGEGMTATATATAAGEGDGGAASGSEAMQDPEAEPSTLMPSSEAMAAAAEDPTAGSANGIDLQAMTKAAIITAMQQRHSVQLERSLSKSELLAAARELEQADRMDR